MLLNANVIYIINNFHINKLIKYNIQNIKKY